MPGIKPPIQDILNQLTTLQVVNQDNQTVGLFARVWNNQFKKQEEGDMQAFPLPAAFVEVMNPLTLKRIGVGVDAGDIVFRIHLGHWFLDATDGTFEQDLGIFDLRDDVVTLLSNFQPTGCSVLMHTGDEQSYDYKKVYVYQLDFTCHFKDSKGSPYDSSATKYVNSVPPTAIEVDLSKLAGAQSSERSFVIPVNTFK